MVLKHLSASTEDTGTPSNASYNSFKASLVSNSDKSLRRKLNRKSQVGNDELQEIVKNGLGKNLAVLKNCKSSQGFAKK